MMIKPAEMAAIYWSRLKGMAIYEIEDKLRHSQAGREYWRKVLDILFDRKDRK